MCQLDQAEPVWNERFKLHLDDHCPPNAELEFVVYYFQQGVRDRLELCVANKVLIGKWLTSGTRLGALVHEECSETKQRVLKEGPKPNHFKPKLRGGQQQSNHLLHLRHPKTNHTMQGTLEIKLTVSRNSSTPI